MTAMYALFLTPQSVIHLLHNSGHMLESYLDSSACICYILCYNSLCASLTWMELEDSRLNGCCNLGWDVGHSPLVFKMFLSHVDSSFGNRHCSVMHHLKLTAQKKTFSWGNNYWIIFKTKVQVIRHGDVTWPKIKWIWFVMLTSNSVTTRSRYGETVAPNLWFPGVYKYLREIPHEVLHQSTPFDLGCFHLIT